MGALRDAFLAIREHAETLALARTCLGEPL
jgi:hypothetical protein